MKTAQLVTLVISDESEPVSVVIFNGKDHTFYSLTRMGMDQLENVLNKCWQDKKI